MKIIYTKSYDKSYKKIKKHSREYNNLLVILDIIESSEDFETLIKLPIVQIYGFERLKHNLN